jgi:hypothetical protein
MAPEEILRGRAPTDDDHADPARAAPLFTPPLPTAPFRAAPNTRKRKMFRVTFLVDDKKLAYALWALTNVALGKPDIEPVVNVKKRRNGVAQQTGGTLLEMFAARLKADKPKQIDAQYVKRWMHESGLNTSSHGYVLKLAQHSKLIRKTGKSLRSGYTVL